jgi:hypothetical protein
MTAKDIVILQARACKVQILLKNIVVYPYSFKVIEKCCIRDRGTSMSLGCAIIGHKVY